MKQSNHWKEAYYKKQTYDECYKYLCKETSEMSISVKIIKLIRDDQYSCKE